MQTIVETGTSLRWVMLTYHNAVSDKLIIFLDYDSSIYQIYSKDNQLKYAIKLFQS